MISFTRMAVAGRSCSVVLGTCRLQIKALLLCSRLWEKCSGKNMLPKSSHFWCLSMLTSSWSIGTMVASSDSCNWRGEGLSQHPAAAVCIQFIFRDTFSLVSCFGSVSFLIFSSVPRLSLFVSWCHKGWSSTLTNLWEFLHYTAVRLVLFQWHTQLVS